MRTIRKLCYNIVSGCFYEQKIVTNGGKEESPSIAGAHITAAERSDGGDVEMPKVLISMLIVLQIPFRLLLAQSF